MLAFNHLPLQVLSALSGLCHKSLLEFSQIGPGVQHNLSTVKYFEQCKLISAYSFSCSLQQQKNLSSEIFIILALPEGAIDSFTVGALPWFTEMLHICIYMQMRKSLVF